MQSISVINQALHFNEVNRFPDFCFLAGDDDDAAVGTALISDGEIPMPEVMSTYQKMVVVTSDNAANVTKAITDSSMALVRCFAHTVNLSVQKFVKVIDEQLRHIRAIVRYFHNSPGATAALKVN